MRRARALLRPEVTLLLIPPLLLLALQLGVFAPRLPGGGATAGEKEPGAAVALSVMSIEPGRSSRGDRTRVPVEESEEVTRAYEDENENEMHSLQDGPRMLELQPWAQDEPSFSAELSRIVLHITKPQLNCSRVLSPGQVQASHPTAASPQPWLLCAEEWLLPAADTPCIAYSFSMDGGDADFLKTVSGMGCQVHSFDPSSTAASGGRRGNSLAGRHGDGGVTSQHRMWLEWRAARRRGHKASVSRTLADIMAALGHPVVHFLYADLLSAEWRVFQNWIELGTSQRIHHLVAKVHLQWAGFEVGGSDEQVLRYWFSVLQGLRASGLRLVHSSAGEGQSVLKRSVRNARSCYTLSWVNMRH
ncbi:probable methyltransferase-like protein 24 [Dunckerocampus dactyliophorus]|uniref:probable methyltransferase-like protein 24 n=1 Tax=Dunckerocampus dactyliophorus TaxID=161453 RepID=UPI002406A44D|nr:probable methyltransferase-like protein 24 [Dunckerocampus dactyliophorus]